MTWPPSGNCCAGSSKAHSSGRHTNGGCFLDEHTKDDPLLRREIESLLTAHESAGPFLSGALPGPPGELPVSPPERTPDASRAGNVAWRVHDSRTARRRRHGRGLPRPRHAARSPGRHQGSVIGARYRARQPRAVRAGGACDLPPVASAHLHGARHRRGHDRRIGGAVSRDGAARWRDARGANRARATLDRAVDRVRDRYRRRTHRGPQPAHRASRPEAGQRHADQHRGEAAGFRSRAAAHARAVRSPGRCGHERPRFDQCRTGHGNAALHVAGAASGREGGYPHRHLCIWRAALRDARRDPPVHRRFAGRPDRRSPRARRAAGERHSAADAGHPRSHHPEVPGEASG